MPRLQHRQGMFLEVALRGSTLLRASGMRDEPAAVRTREYPSADEARWAMAKLVARHLRDDFSWDGPARVLPAAPPGTDGADDGDGGYAGDPIGGQPLPEVASSLMLEEHFAAGDDRFLGELAACMHAHKLAALAEPWAKDARPWARRMLLAYIDDGCDRPHHKALVKRLFKLVEAAGDDEAMGHFQVAFDRLGRRALLSLRKMVWKDGAWKVETKPQLVEDESVPGRLVVPGGKPRESPQFSRVTRRYLARRAARYFRRLGHRDPLRYRRAMMLALPRYRDGVLASASRFLDSWGLLRALYAGSPVLAPTRNGLRLAEGQSLAALAPAPQFPRVWSGEGNDDDAAGAFAALRTLLLTAESRTVRGWALALLRQHHATRLAQLGLAELLPLLRSEHEEALRLGTELLPRLRGLELLPVTDWLALLALENLDVLGVVAQLAEKSLAPKRLSLAQSLELAAAKAAAVAMLGLTWARTKSIGSATELRAVVALARAGVAEVRTAGVRWALELLGAGGSAHASLELVRDLADAPHGDARALVLAALVGAQAPLGRFAAEPALWFALIESPYDDVRALVLAQVERWRAEAAPQTVRHLWATAVAAVHRGSAAKARAARQIAERLVTHPDEAEALLPILGLALRSVRPAERALALGALARAVRGSAGSSQGSGSEGTRGLAALAEQLLPELSISHEVVQ